MDSSIITWRDLTDEASGEAARIIGDEVVRLAPIPTKLTPRVQKWPSLKAVLFDIYGTLLISGTGDISLAREKENSFSMEKALHALDLELTLLNGPSELSDRLTAEVKASHAREKEGGADYPEVDIISLWHRVLKGLERESLLDGEITDRDLAVLSAYHEIVSNPVWEMPGAFSLLPELRDRGYPLGIVSNAQYYTPLTIERLSGHTLEELGFDRGLCSWSYRLLRGKPSRVLFEEPLKELAARGINPNDVLYVGNDMLNDIYTASLWGCRTALFAGDQRSLRLREEDDRCQDLTPDLILTDLSQLKEVL